MFADFIVREKHCYFAETIRLIREATGDRLFDTAGPRKNFGMHVCKEFMGVGGDLECMCAQGIQDTLVRLFPTPWG